jgi:DNA-binding MarR family transcriptional regulator
MTSPGIGSQPARSGPAAGGSGETALPESLAEVLRTPFDAVLIDPIRLRLQAALHGLPPDGSMTFTALRKTLQLSDGNLAAHLAILVDAGYAVTTVTWRGKRRTTRYAASSAGRAAFEAHVRALEAVIGAAQPRPDEP